jgi:hypothetical protein
MDAVRIVAFMGRLGWSYDESAALGGEGNTSETVRLDLESSRSLLRLGRAKGANGHTALRVLPPSSRLSSTADKCLSWQCPERIEDSIIKSGRNSSLCNESK